MYVAKQTNVRTYEHIDISYKAQFHGKYVKNLLFYYKNYNKSSSFILH